MKDSLPVRQCAVCKQKQAKPLLFRFVRGKSDTIILDESQKINQRGIYLCKTPNCVKKAKEYHILEHAWKGTIKPELYLSLAHAVSDSPENQIATMIGLSVKSRQTIIGLDAIERITNHSMIRMIVIDKTVGVHSRKQAVHFAEKHKIPFIELPENMDLSHTIGMTNCKVLGLKNAHFAQAMTRLINQMNAGS